MGLLETFTNTGQKVKVHINILGERKNLLRRFTTEQLVSLCRERNISTVKKLPKKGSMFGMIEKKKTFDELIWSIETSGIKLSEIIEFAERKKVNAFEIIQRIRRLLEERETIRVEKEISSATNLANNFVNQIIEEIKGFKPLRNYYQESEYEAELSGYLKTKFPNLKVQVAQGASRPDIVIGDIAIELKGPTDTNGLGTIADKAIRYSKHFKVGLIVVLFDVQVDPFHYNEWFTQFSLHFPGITIIKK